VNGRQSDEGKNKKKRLKMHDIKIQKRTMR